MDKDRVKGAINDAAGRAKRQVGEWTGNTDAQVEGAAQQIKGKAQKVVGNAKDMARDAVAKVDRENEREKGREQDRERQRESEHAHHG
ncbi:MAG: CsbD family protein [Terracidiphilus sp.]